MTYTPSYSISLLTSKHLQWRPKRGFWVFPADQFFDQPFISHFIVQKCYKCIAFQDFSASKFCRRTRRRMTFKISWFLQDLDFNSLWVHLTLWRNRRASNVTLIQYLVWAWIILQLTQQQLLWKSNRIRLFQKLEEILNCPCHATIHSSWLQPAQPK